MDSQQYHAKEEYNAVVTDPSEAYLNLKSWSNAPFLGQIRVQQSTTNCLRHGRFTFGVSSNVMLMKNEMMSTLREDAPTSRISRLWSDTPLLVQDSFSTPQITLESDLVFHNHKQI